MQCCKTEPHYQACGGAYRVRSACNYLLAAATYNGLWCCTHSQPVTKAADGLLQVLLVQGGLQHVLQGAQASGEVIAKLLSLELFPGGCRLLLMVGC